MANIALNKPSGGQLILSPEDGTSTETVTIPSVGVGKVLQVVNQHSNTEVSTSSNAWTDSAITATITPSSTNSKIVVMVNPWCSLNQPQAGLRLHIKCNGALVNSTLSVQEFYHGGDAYYFEVVMPIVITHEPASTSALTYTVVFSNSANGTYDSVRCGVSNRYSYITLMEVAA